MLEYYTKDLDYNMSDKVIFSGVQPSGEIHIGNYLGAISQFVDYQTDYKSIFSIVDLHAITVWQDSEALRNSTREVLAIFLASGLDESKNIIFNPFCNIFKILNYWNMFICCSMIDYFYGMTLQNFR